MVASNPSQKTLVMKFGGSSVGTPQAMRQAAEIVQKTFPDWPRLVVITSALSGVTNILLESATKAAQGDALTFYQARETLRQAHYAIADLIVMDPARRASVKQEIDHLISDFTSLCQAITVLGESTPRALDAVASLGERMAVRLLAAVLESQGCLPCKGL